MVWSEKEQNLSLIAGILTETKHPMPETVIRKQFNLSKLNTETIVGTLIECKLLKVYSNAPTVQNRIVIISQKGHEFLKRFRKLLEILGLDPNDKKSIATWDD